MIDSLIHNLILKKSYCMAWSVYNKINHLPASVKNFDILRINVLISYVSSRFSQQRDATES